MKRTLTLIFFCSFFSSIFCQTDAQILEYKGNSFSINVPENTSVSLTYVKYNGDGTPDLKGDNFISISQSNA